jgi:polar amino acid transport system substrate-binding protein
MIFSALTLVGANASHAQSCGGEHVVAAGDTLSRLAEAAYGKADLFNLIYSANADAIGPNPGKISVGQVLVIPCIGGDLGQSTANVEAIRAVDTTAAIPAPGPSRPIRVLTATGWAPFMDEDQEQGGLLTELINLALENASGRPAYQIDFINDDGAHLNPLIVDHAYDISIGWSRPDCEAMETLADESLFRCNNLAFSDPLYEEVLGYFGRSGGAELTNHDQLRGQRICRAEAYTLAPLESVGLAEPDITVVRAPTEAECIDFVLLNRADFALVAIDVAERQMMNRQATDQIRMHEALTYVDVLYAVIAKTHPRRDDILATVNDGLRHIKDSGLWFETVRRHLVAFRTANQT